MALTDRQTEIVRHLHGGLTNKEIARRLGISPATVKVQLSSICRRLGARNRTQIVGITSHRLEKNHEG